MPKNPFLSVYYRPELETSIEFNEDQVIFYQNLIVLLIYIIKIGRIDIVFDVSALSRYIAFPRTGHLVQALNILKYLEIFNANDLAFDTCYQHVISDQYIQSKFQEMKDFYVDAGE